MKILSEIHQTLASFGLQLPDLPEILIEEVNREELIILSAHSGFPKRWFHWYWGQTMEILSQQEVVLKSRILEAALWSKPYVIYLYRGLDTVTRKLVIAHALAHLEFFYNNRNFRDLRSMAEHIIDLMSARQTLVELLKEKVGAKVDDFLETALSLRNLIDPYTLYFKRKVEEENEEDTKVNHGFRLPVPRPYLEPYINPPDLVRLKKPEPKDLTRKIFRPERDILLFLIQYAPLEDWQKLILSIIRDESYYFVPVASTIMMNEGWAQYWTSLLFTHKVIEPKEVVDYADVFSVVSARNFFLPIISQPSYLNYFVAREIWRDIEDRWNRGKFGPEWGKCDDLLQREKWDQKLMLGQKKIFEVREMANDITFIENYLTDELIIKHHWHIFVSGGNIIEIEPARLKSALLKLKTNLGEPIIELVDDNYQNRMELYLIHKHIGFDLRKDWAEKTLIRIAKVWKRPVHLETILRGKKSILTAHPNGKTEVKDGN